MICELRRKHPGWGPRRIGHQLARQGVEPLPSCSSIYRCLKRHNLIELRRRRKRRDEFRRFERDRAMQLWQQSIGRSARAFSPRSTRPLAAARLSALGLFTRSEPAAHFSLDLAGCSGSSLRSLSEFLQCEKGRGGPGCQTVGFFPLRRSGLARPLREASPSDVA